MTVIKPGVRMEKGNVTEVLFPLSMKWRGARGEEVLWKN
jgi:hypothetical protein